ncbi:helix-turn-helix domain-containing protein [uncultured Ruminococcus sp.]|mgnify:CR=1 FL=1|uniref:helix-turn-helix domain-containing protein n=1 Tax=uncultured Ruminococcus sp. TaxID=165186 RepID=UPI0015B53924|nr:helix-turn-helix domain-containing protein [uncultured Ruminococcus sp.]
MKLSYYYLPNSLTEKKMLPSDFAMAAFLYSMAQAYGNVNMYGIYVKVKQTTIADACGISVESVARATKRLIKAGVIISRERSVKANRHLGTYTYTLEAIGDRFFRVDRKAAKRLTAKELRCYCLFCKCKQNSSKMFFHSYSDLAKMLGVKRSEIMALVNKLIKLKVIHRRYQVTAYGDFGENRYYVFEFVTGHIRKKCKKRTAAQSGPHKTHNPATSRKSLNLHKFYHQLEDLSRGYEKKLKKSRAGPHFLFKGRGNFDRSYL